MQYSAILASLLTVVSGAAILSSRTELPAGYTLSEMKWTGALEEGGEEVSFMGTIESVVEQIQTLNPDFVVPNATEVTNPSADISSLAARTQLPPLCWNGYGWADSSVIQQGVNYLQRLSGRCGVGARSCARISCSYNGAIFLCNDNNYFIEPACNYMGYSAQWIVNSCSKHAMYCSGNQCLNLLWTQGQQFDTDNYNVLVRRDNC